MEDDRTTSQALRALLSRRGWDVVVAAGVREGLQAMEKGEFHAVILDLMLPDGDGVSVFRQIRSRSPQTRVIITTGTSDPTRLKAVDDLHPDALLHKPIDFPDLLRHLARDDASGGGGA